MIPATHILTYDVETLRQQPTDRVPLEATGGDAPDDTMGLVEIGLALWELGNDSPLSTLHLHFGVPKQACERTMKEFWTNPKYADQDGKLQLDKLKERDASIDAVSMHDGALKVYRFCLYANKLASGKVLLCSDTAGFDAQWLSYLFSFVETKDLEGLDVDRLPYSASYAFGEYRSPKCIDDFSEGRTGVLHVKGASKAIAALVPKDHPLKNKYKATHCSLDDANSIAASFMMANPQLGKKRKHETITEEESSAKQCKVEE